MTFLFVTGVLAVTWVIVAALLCVGLCSIAAEGDRKMVEGVTRAGRRRRFDRAGLPKTF
ncbi:MAG: hypothetical protein M3P40_06070 [Actinomycetota bacterium]|nr:hypothetical protein [Actinomycetota bacterium]